MNNTTIRSLSLAVSTLALLAACGGGGDATAPEKTRVNADATLRSALLNGLAATVLSGTDKAGNSYGMTITQPAGEPSQIPCGPWRSTQTISVTRNGAPLASATSQTYFSCNRTLNLQKTVRGNGQVWDYGSTAELPAAAVPGDTGTFSTFTIYPSETVNIPVGTGTVAWSIEAGTGNTPSVCLTSSSAQLQPETFCYRTDASGAVAGTKATISINNELITFK